MTNKLTIQVQGKDVEIELTDEQLAKIRGEEEWPKGGGGR